MNIGTVGTDSVLPNEEKSADIFSRVGYKIEEAVADLVDNSIDAHASQVLIRFVRSSQGIHSVIIADNGDGMNDEELLEAMRFGTRTTKDASALGKYGIGLKSASLSQAQTVTVLSRCAGTTIGRRWTVENIRKNWQCERLESSQSAQFMDASFGPVTHTGNGTVVVWDRLEHLRAGGGHVDKVLEKVRRSLSVELGIKFHRILSAGRVTIFIDDIEITEDEASLPVPVESLDPFGYSGSGHPKYPKALVIPIGRTEQLRLICHVWPPKSRDPGYKLGGGRVASRQGFYFYRNDRLIQAGGWNGLQADDSEPHMSLARVQIDLPPSLESSFKLDIGKSSIDPPSDFIVNLTAAGQYREFTQFLDDAEDAYRHQKKKESARFPLIPGAGMPRGVRAKIRTAFRETGVPAPAEIAFVWMRMEPDEVIRLDSAAQQIQFNRRYKTDLTQNIGHDGAIIKLLILLLFQDEMGKSFLTAPSRDRLARINQALLATFAA
ncbi:ATP-binding protein [Variovorax robiniae]|uniref:ATP-binding protein n=1 Tax=Variovorax robiniae TaxID=1836199 RepID=A0ABU8XHX3_9BURK